MFFRQAARVSANDLAGAKIIARKGQRFNRHRSCLWLTILNAVVLLCPAPARSTQPPANGDLSTGNSPAIKSIGPQRIAKSLLAAWSYDETSGVVCREVSGRGHDATVDPCSAAAVQRVPGLFGNALSFSANHAVRVQSDLRLEGIEKISFSAWVAPTELSTYREIFRKEDGDDRVLFSFQNGGACLSLGLNVSGYVECRAPIDTHQVMDGAWHHCAATFDGQWMRVYFDGREIGRLERPGKIHAGARPALSGPAMAANAFIRDC